MSIGDPVTQPIPVVGEFGTGYATKIVNFLSEVKTRLEAKVPLTSLLAGLFDLANNAIGNAKYLGLYEQTAAPTTPIGSLQRYGNNLYYVSTSGAVRVTNGSALDIVSANGITGDYAAPAEFKYVLADTEYYAYSDEDAAPKQWAYVGARAFDVYGTLTSTTRVRVTWGGGASWTLTLPAAPPGSAALLQMSNTGAVTASNTLANGITATDFLHTVEQTVMVPSIMSMEVTPTHTRGLPSWVLINSSNGIYFPIPITSSRILTGVTVYVRKLTGAGVTLRVRVYKNAAGVTTQIGADASTSAAAPGYTSIATAALTETITSTHQYYVEVMCPVGVPTGDEILNMSFSFKGA